MTKANFLYLLLISSLEVYAGSFLLTYDDFPECKKIVKEKIDTESPIQPIPGVADSVESYKDYYTEKYKQAKNCQSSVTIRYNNSKHKIYDILRKKSETYKARNESDIENYSLCLNQLETFNKKQMSSLRKQMQSYAVTFKKFKTSFRMKVSEFKYEIERNVIKASNTNERYQLYSLLEEIEKDKRSIVLLTRNLKNEFKIKQHELGINDEIIFNEVLSIESCNSVNISQYIIDSSYLSERVGQMVGSANKLLVQFEKLSEDLKNKIKTKIDRINKSQEIAMTEDSLKKAIHLRSVNTLLRKMKKQIDDVFNKEYQSKIADLDYLQPKKIAIENYLHLDMICSGDTPAYAGAACLRSDKYREKAKKLDDRYFKYLIETGISVLQQMGKIEDETEKSLNDLLYKNKIDEAIVLYDLIISGRGMK